MPRPIRVFVDHEGTLRRACTISVTNRDASIYVQPAAHSGTYHYGLATLPLSEQSVTFNFKGKLSAAQEPHISLHQFGVVHVRSRGGPNAGPVRIPPLSELRGQHVATVTAETLERFPAYRGARENLHGDLDRLITVGHEVPSGRLSIHLNGAAPTLTAPDERIAFTLTINNPNLAMPLYLGVATWSQLALGTEHGTVAIAGFQPDGTGEDLLYLVGD